MQTQTDARTWPMSDDDHMRPLRSYKLDRATCEELLKVELRLEQMGLVRVGPQRTHPSIHPSIATRTRYPDGMFPISDAPTQPRTYSTPSLTSRKEMPAFFNRRPPLQPSDEEEDELTEEPLV
ncbi:hypothetical protein C8R46DRAFT_1027960 [Mycena filopes]|nr:hypothetical protein C8R46DRAFT_1027960 [Mycena filopes]